MKTLVLGLGNPLVTDDSVGLRVVAALRERLGGTQSASATGDGTRRGCEEKGTGTSRSREFAVLGDGGSEPVPFPSPRTLNPLTATAGRRWRSRAGP